MNANYSNVSMLDMVFEHRNKAYGAYVLRRDYNKSLQQAMLSILTVVTVFCFGNYIRQNMHPKNNNDNKFGAPIVVTDIQKVQQKEVTKPKPQATQKPKPQPVATIADPEKKVVAENKPHEDSIPTVQQLQNVESGLTTNLAAPSTGLGVPDGKGNDQVLEAAKQVQPAAPQVFAWAEEMPEFPGGEKALLKFVADNVQYPEMEHDNDISGKVTARFTVNEDGSISDVQILKSTSIGFTREVKHVIGKLPLFKPGKQEGRPVKVSFILPVSFNLKH